MSGLSGGNASHRTGDRVIHRGEHSQQNGGQIVLVCRRYPMDMISVAMIIAALIAAAAGYYIMKPEKG